MLNFGFRAQSRRGGAAGCSKDRSIRILAAVGPPGRCRRRRVVDSSLNIVQTTQLEAVGFDTYGRQSHVQWLNGAFVATWLSNSGPMKLAQYATDGSPAGNIIIVPPMIPPVSCLARRKQMETSPSQGASSQ